MSQKNAEHAREWLDENIGREQWTHQRRISLTNLLDEVAADAVRFIHDASAEELAKARTQGAERVIYELRTEANRRASNHIPGAEAIRQCIDKLKDAEPVPDWEDVADEWTKMIKAAHPMRSGSHDEYAMAMKMVGHRHSKRALVELVNWLLLELAACRDALRDAARFAPPAVADRARALLPEVVK